MYLTSCHPERRKAYTPPAVEPVGRCIASGSTRGKDDILARDPARLRLALLRSSTAPPRVILSEGASPNRTAKRRRALRDGISEGASLRMTRRDFALQENMSLIQSVVVKKKGRGILAISRPFPIGR